MMLFTAWLLASVEVVVVTTGIDARDSTMWRWSAAGQVVAGTLEHAPGAAPQGVVITQGSRRTVVVTRRSESVVSAELVAMPLGREPNRPSVLATGVEPLQGPRWHEGRLAFVRVLDEAKLSYDIVGCDVDGSNHQVLAHADGYLVPALSDDHNDPLRFLRIDADGSHHLVAVHNGALVVEQALGAGVFRSPVVVGPLQHPRWAIEKVEGPKGTIIVDGIPQDQVIAGSHLRPHDGGLLYAAGKSGVVRSDDKTTFAQSPMVGVARPVASLGDDVIVELDRGFAEPRQLWWLPKEGVAKKFVIPPGTMATVLMSVQVQP